MKINSISKEGIRKMPKVTDETDASIVADVIVGGLGGKPQIFQVPLKGLKFISLNINLNFLFSPFQIYRFGAGL